MDRERNNQGISYSLAIYLGLGSMRSGSNNQVMAVIGLTLLATSLSALFASFILGIFQGSVSQQMIDIRVMRVSRIAAENDRAIWELTLSLRNNGHSILEIPYIDLIVADDTIIPRSSSTGASAPLRIMPGELRILRVIITNYNTTQTSGGDAVIFSYKELREGITINLRIMDSEGHVVLIPLTLS